LCFAAAVDIVIIVMLVLFPLELLLLLLGGSPRRWRARWRSGLTHGMAARQMFALHVALKAKAGDR